jgi:hypothetical protein
MTWKGRGRDVCSIFERATFKIRSNKANYYVVNSSFFQHRTATSPITPQYQQATLRVAWALVLGYLNVHGNGGKAAPIIHVDIGTGSWAIKFMFQLLNLEEQPHYPARNLSQSRFGHEQLREDFRKQNLIIQTLTSQSGELLWLQWFYTSHKVRHLN